MFVTSAYLIRQAAYISDGSGGKPSQIATKQKLKEILFRYPSTFEYEFHFVPFNISGGIKTAERIGVAQGETYEHTNIFITRFNEIQLQPTYWVHSNTGDYMTVGDNWVWHDVPYYALREYSSVVRVGVDYRGEEKISETTWTGTGDIAMFARRNKKDVVSAQVGTATHTCFGLGIDILLPIFTDEEDGEAYSTAAYNYHHEPTDSNYDTVCSYIDRCENPDG